MVLKEREFDFKEVREGEVVAHAFEVHNEGDQALKIIRVKPGQCNLAGKLTYKMNG